LNQKFDPKTDKVRPIAAGDFVMRVASSIACELDQKALEQYLSPYQLGLGVSGGSEVLPWIVQQQLLTGNTIVVAFDEKQAFQYIDRAQAANRAIELCHASARMIKFEYQYSPTVHFARDGKSFPLRSETGVKQGHGLGGVVYAVGKHPVYQAMAAVHKSLTVRAYYDDSYLFGSAASSFEHLDSAVTTWVKGTEKLGGVPSPDKCVVYYTAEGPDGQEVAERAAELAQRHGFRLVDTAEGIEVCGVPVGGHRWVASRLAGHVDRHERLFQQLKRMDPQCANLLLRQCVQPRMGHLLRTVPARVLQESICRFDDMIEDAFRHIGGLPDVDSLFIRAPFSKGGLGLRPLETVSPAANIASLSLCLPELRKVAPELDRFVKELSSKPYVLPTGLMEAEAFGHEAVDKGAPILGVLFSAWTQLWQAGLSKTIPKHPWAIVRGHYEKEAKDDEMPRRFKIQKYITGELDSRMGERLHHITKDKPKVAARILSNQHSGATAWLRALPVKPSLRMEPLVFRQAVGIFCGIAPLALPSGTRCCLAKDCRVGNAVLDLPHALSCKGLSAVKTRHDTILGDLHNYMRLRRVLVKKEWFADGSKSRKWRVDLWVRTDDAQEIWTDVSITEPGCATYLAVGSDRKAGVAAKKRESVKMADWSKVVRDLGRVGVQVAPLVLETTGRLGGDFEKFLSTIESVSRGGPRTHLISQISVTLAKWNVECVREAGRKAAEAQLQ
jgi:hypothetical protein